MMYEVELKFPLADPRALREQIDALGAICQAPLVQCDTYFSHPGRNFAETDEALRIRTSGDRNYLTYKGPIVDTLAKTRHEIEIPFGSGVADWERLAALLECLGFCRFGSVNKQRQPFHLDWEDRQLELVIDEVEELGIFLEIETMADEQEKTKARDCILRLANQLGLENSERRSYLCLLFAPGDS